MVCLIDGTLKQPHPYGGFVFLGNSTVYSQLLSKLFDRDLEAILCSCLAPILVDAVLELDDGHISDLVREGLV